MNQFEAFLTGSHAYGLPRADSDVDIVVLVDAEGLDVLRRASGRDPDKECESRGSAHNAVERGDSLMFGKVNLICPPNRAQFDAWHTATVNLRVRRPVTRDEAIAEIEAQLNSIDECRKFIGRIS